MGKLSHANWHPTEGSNLKLYKCEKCEESFKGPYSLKRHATCNLCEDYGKYFNVKDSLREHKKKHANLRPHKCGDCGESYFAAAALRNHKLTHSGDCFTRSDSVENDQASLCRYVNPILYRCEYCGRSFSRNYNLQKHLAFHRKLDLYKYTSQVSTNSSSLKEQQKAKYQSKENTSYSRTGSLEKYEASHSNPQTSSTQIASHSKKKHKCDECHKSFVSFYGYRTHKKLHTNPDLFKCKDCGARCRDSSYLSAHQRRYCPSKGPFKCTHCEKQLSTLDAFEKHQVAQLNSDAYKCQECGKLFNNLPCLKQHQAVIHPTEKLHKCEICGKLLRNAYDFKCHLASHANPDLYKCKECGKSLGSSASLKRHSMSRHGNSISHKCEKCHRSFDNSHSLEIHMDWHLSFTCGECGKLLFNDATFKAHQLSHSNTNDNDHKCQECGKSFSNASAFKNHLLWNCISDAATFKAHHLSHS